MGAQIFGDFARRVESEEIEPDPLKLDQFFDERVLWNWDPRNVDLLNRAERKRLIRVVARVMLHSCNDELMETTDNWLVRECVVGKGSSLESFHQALGTIDTRRPEVLDRHVLKNLYHHLVYWSLHCSDIRNSKPGRDKRFNDIRNVCDTLFGELSNRFERLYSALFSVPEDVITGRYGLDSDMWGAQPEFTMLLRCCILIVPFLELDQSVLMEKCEILLSIMSKLCSPDLPFLISRHVREVKERIMKYRRLVSYECTNPGDGLVTAALEESQTILYSAEHSTSPMPLFSSILEVFMDELLVHKHLRQYFVAIDAISCSKEKILRREFDYADGVSNLVTELISAHFLLLASDEQAFARSLNRLSWLHDKRYPTAEVRLISAMSFLGDPIMFTAPQLLQAYGISLVNSCIAKSKASDGDGFNCKLMNCYLSAFERGFYLYTRSISGLKLENHSSGAESGSASRRKSCSSRRSFCPTFQSCLRPVTFDNIMLQVAKLADKGHSPSSEMVSNLLNSFAADIEKDEFILDNSYRDELLLNLNCIISKVTSGDIESFVFSRSGDISWREMQLLASIIKLMSSSLLKTICCIQRGNPGCLKTSKDSSREFDSIRSIVGYFSQITSSQSAKKPFLEAERTDQVNHGEANMMLMHFAGMLRFSIEKEHEYLARACLFMITTLMNLIIVENGSLDAVKLLLDPVNKSLSVRTSIKSSEVIFFVLEVSVLVSIFSKLVHDTILKRETSQNLLLLKDVEETMLSADEDSTCNGEAFISLLQEGNAMPSDLDELADFIVCKQGKDYSSWLKDRERFRQWKGSKKASFRKQRRKRFWGELHQ
ncbi:hypothetical protein Scep_023180 [Stephania cephalantha]|uniref:DUF7812 domain-containing protein n=1 Tax=Stephania cephalantha TaxID=152367 RepID=A0AAP0HXC2_9MAGN